MMDSSSALLPANCSVQLLTSLLMPSAASRLYPSPNDVLMVRQVTVPAGWPIERHVKVSITASSAAK